MKKGLRPFRVDRFPKKMEIGRQALMKKGLRHGLLCGDVHCCKIGRQALMKKGLRRVLLVIGGELGLLGDKP